jgi:hypothetical protein
VEKVLEDEEQKYLRQHQLPRWKGDVIGAHPEGFSGRVEKRDLQLILKKKKLSLC